MTSLLVHAPDGVGEVGPGADLAGLLLGALAAAPAGPAGLGALEDGDVVVVTSKVVAKAEGRVVPGADREAAIDAELARPGARLVARRGPTRIVRTTHGLTLAAAGVDASNVARGHVVLLPADPDASARALRTALQTRTGVRLAVVVSDTAGRPWREGQTDLAIGAAGLVVADDHAGRFDAHGNELAVTAPAVADEVAGAADLVRGKLAGRPFAVLRGLGHLVLPATDDGPGAVALTRAPGGDMFGLGAREAVVHALVGGPAARTAFGAPAPAGDVADALTRVLGGPVLTPAPRDPGTDGPDPHLHVATVPDDPRLTAVLRAYAWEVAQGPTGAGGTAPGGTWVRPASGRP